MRKFLFITVILLSFQGKAQMWFANGAEWHYYVNYFSISAIGHSGNGHYKISVTNSLTIAGDTCFELSRKFTGIPTWPTYPPVVNVDKGKFLVKVKNNVLSLCTNTGTATFDTICDFNAVVGDKWKTLLDYGCSASNATTEVTSVSTVTINNVALKRIGVVNKYAYSASYTITSYNVYTEKFGGNVSFYFYNCCTPDCGQSFGTLSCYQDDNFPLYKVPGYTLACNYSPVVIKENNFNNSDLEIYPQPANNVLNLSSVLFSNKTAQIQIINNLGQLCYEQQIQFYNGNAQLPVANLPKGIYFLKLIDEDLKTFTQKLIIE